jgi:hypothetical protein
MKRSGSSIDYWLTILVGAAAAFLLTVSILHGPSHYLEHSENSQDPQHECPICALLSHSNYILVSQFEAPIPFETWTILHLRYSLEESRPSLPLIYSRAPPAYIPV